MPSIANETINLAAWLYLPVPPANTEASAKQPPIVVMAHGLVCACACACVLCISALKFCDCVCLCVLVRTFVYLARCRHGSQRVRS